MSSWLARGVVIWRQRLKKLFLPYVVATVLYVLLMHRFLDATTLLTYLLHFNASGPLYYVAVYVQMVLITPVLIGIIRWCGKGRKWFRYILAWNFVLVVCYLTVHFSNVFDIAIGGGNLFGGPWLLFWFAGMCIRAWDIHIKKIKMKYVVIFLLTMLVVIWQWVFVVRGYNLSLRPIFHGTKVGMTWANTFETVLLFFWFKGAVELAESFWGAATHKSLRLLGFIGRHSLYVFLYHMFFLAIYKKLLHPYLGGRMSLLFIIFAPIVLEYCFMAFQKFGNKLMRGIQVDDAVL